jgi:hypothetical protein
MAELRALSRWLNKHSLAALLLKLDVHDALPCLCAGGSVIYNADACSGVKDLFYRNLDGEALRRRPAL